MPMRYVTKNRHVCVPVPLSVCGACAWLNPPQIKLPAEQVIDIQTQQRLETNAEGDDEDGADNGDAADDDVSPEDRAIQERVYKAVLAGMADVVALMKTEPSNPVLQWWCCDGIASLCAGNGASPCLAVAPLSTSPCTLRVPMLQPRTVPWRSVRAHRS